MRGQIITEVPNPLMNSPYTLTNQNWKPYRYNYNSRLCTLMFSRVIPAGTEPTLVVPGATSTLAPPTPAENVQEAQSQVFEHK